MIGTTTNRLGSCANSVGHLPLARVVWCFIAIQRQLAATFVQMLRSGVLRKLDRIAKSPGHPDANAAHFFLSSNRWRDDNGVFIALATDNNVLKILG